MKSKHCFDSNNCQAITMMVMAAGKFDPRHMESMGGEILNFSGNLDAPIVIPAGSMYGFNVSGCRVPAVNFIERQ